MSLETPLAKVKGLGSAKQGTHHWWQQRLTAVALIPLSIWFISSLLMMTTMDHATVIQWIHSPLTTVLLILFIIALFYHAQLGMQVVVEDYIAIEWQKIACVVLIDFLAILAAMAAVIAVLRIFLGL